MSEPFIAEIRIFAGNFAPRGWAFCDGQLLPISQNTALFSLIGATYGGDGRSTTALPDLQGRAPMHPGRGPGLAVRTLGERGGASSITLEEQHMPPHTHAVHAFTGPASAAPDTAVGLGSAPMYAAGSANAPMATGLVGAAGSTAPAPHNNLQPYLALNFIIALQGLYPSRS